MVLDNVLVLQVMMKLNLLLQGLVLTGEEEEEGRRKRRGGGRGGEEEEEEEGRRKRRGGERGGVCFAIYLALSSLTTPQGAN